jgi:hypothetical protein
MGQPYRIPANSPDLNGDLTGAVANFDLAFGTQPVSASGAVTIKEGTVFLEGSGALAMTLAVPTSGAQSAGGDDGRELLFVDNSGHAHTITTPSNGINGSKHVATFGGTLGQCCLLVARAGGWIARSELGITIS